MVVNLAAWTLFAISLVSVSGAPGLGFGTLRKSPSPQPQRESRLPTYKTIDNKDVPVFTAESTAAEVRDRWKAAKDKGRKHFASTKKMLEIAASFEEKPNYDQLDLLQNRASLEKQHTLLEGWRTFFRSDLGHEFDPEFRRKYSAAVHGALTQQWSGQTNVLVVDTKLPWPHIQEQIPKRLAAMEENHEHESTFKKKHARAHYGAFVEHMRKGGKATEIPFVSSLDAKSKGVPQHSGESSGSSSQSEIQPA